MQSANVSSLKRQLKDAGINVLSCQRSERFAALAMVQDLSDEQIAKLSQIAPNANIEHAGSNISFINS